MRGGRGREGGRTEVQSDRQSWRAKDKSGEGKRGGGELWDEKQMG